MYPFPISLIWATALGLLCRYAGVFREQWNVFGSNVRCTESPRVQVNLAVDSGRKKVLMRIPTKTKTFLEREKINDSKGTKK